MQWQELLKEFWRKNKKLVGSLAVVSAMLPVFLWAAVEAPRMSLVSRASGEELRIWWEPAQIVVGTNPARVKLMAEYSSTSKYLNTIKLDVHESEGVRVTPEDVDFNDVFSGRVILGEFELRGIKQGKWEVRINETSVFTGLPDLTVISSPLVVLVN